MYSLYSPELTLGIVGGGQLGRMMTFEAKKLGLKVVVLDPTEQSPAAQVADEQIVSSFDDLDGYRTLAKLSDIITYEFEHIHVSGLQEIEAAGVPVRPGSATLASIQHKGKQKELLRTHGIAVPSFQYAKGYQQAASELNKFKFPVMAKLCHGGYDGKGNILLENESDLRKLETMAGENRELMLEKYLRFDKELSVMAAKSANGDTAVFPVVENVHKDEILHLTKAPADISSYARDQLISTAEKILEIFSEPGIYGIEFFLLEDDSIMVNEIAPRVHNSGHYTIEACNLCQFAVHLRSILGLPLIHPKLEKNAVMINLLGSEQGELPITNYDSLLTHEGVYLHLYGKQETRPGRKMGHITITGQNEQDLVSKVNNLEIIDKRGILDEL
ncbi:5-(carboxyamino)imidazole ribonucleotide synthase [Natranaerobius thermophilus]|uniref:N5-carboxyaminoimidazole ribonucleotide synthase n=1 Tax=Natranaerobius thermophilus (strain ATCC BAA-1301 / DSM 18059 / JW/NM-WN-LF) TaxID=457570 RepID=B2A5V6_NATTJ|nr:5-(carboxyamino)imidazole ribonucleotide synthase [Natranaerobius thermophilus]ACB84049.1 phosphoribosylaminoimidazole carboxylase, ATPase subunit [Natranaerobius thermophilus JW/NM-WN-LF]